MSEATAVHQADARPQTILKAVVVGARAQDPSSRAAARICRAAGNGNRVPPAWISPESNDN